MEKMHLNCESKAFESPSIKRPRGWKKSSQGRDERRTSMEDLYPEIIENIFQRLPVLSIVQFKLVCKSWHRTFHRHHSQAVSTPPRNPTLLFVPKKLSKFYFYDGEKGPMKMNTPVKNLRDWINNLLSCNGLLCLLSSVGWRWHLKLRVCIYNPLTKEHNFLPSLELRKPFYHHYGFGFHRETNEFKVVRVIGNLENDRITNCVEVFTVTKLGSWRVVNENPVLVFEHSSDVVVDGSIHWLCKETYNAIRSRLIVSFDLIEEKFHQIAPPPFDIGSHSFLSVLGGCLALTDPRRTQVTVWMMKKDGKESSWIKEVVITVPNILSTTLGRIELVRPLCILKNGDIMVSYNERDLYLYRPEHMHFEAVGTRSLIKIKKFMVLPYSPILYFPG